MSLRAIRGLVEREFPALVTDTEIIDNKIRVFLVDGSYIDFWWSTQIPGRYSYHWERRHIDGTVYRHDNMPHAVFVYRLLQCLSEPPRTRRAQRVYNPNIASHRRSHRERRERLF